MSDAPSSPDVLPISSKPRTGMLMASATALALAVTSGVVVGFVWSGGGPAAIAEPPVQVATASTTAAAQGPVLMGTAYLPSLADIVQRVSPAVVSLKAKVTSTNETEFSDEDLENLPPSLRDFFDRFRRQGPNNRDRGRQRGEVQGSGFVIDPTGYLVTNNHVVSNSSEIEVSFSDGRKFKAKLIGRDELTDIALLKIDTAGKQLPSVRFADDAKVRVGDWVLAVGNPFGLGGTVTAGIVSARSRNEVGGTQYTDYLQVDAAINRGNSGGPTFDMTGNVIGMNTAIFSPSGGSVGIGFAIPSSTVQRVIDELKRSGAVTRGWLGVQIQSLSDEAAEALGLPDASGAIVAEVIAGSPAQKSGIKQGDVVLKMNGTLIKDNRDLSRKVAGLKVGQSASFVVWRGNKQMTFNVLIAKRPGEDTLAGNNTDRDKDDDDKGKRAEAGIDSLGLELSPITPSMRSEYDLARTATGVVITEVDPDSDAAERGLRAGDRIIAVGGDEVKTLSDVKAAVAEAKSQKRSSVLLFIETQRGGRPTKAYVAVKLKG